MSIIFFTGLFEKDSINEEKATQLIQPLKTPAHLISKYTDIDAVIQGYVSELDERLDEFVSSG